MLVYIIIGITVILLVILGSTFAFYYYKFQYLMIRMDEAENNIDILLQKKIECISKLIPIIQKKTKEKDFLDDFSSIRKNERDHFEMNEMLKNSHIEIIKVISDQEKLLKVEEFVALMEELEDNEENLVASIKYYNDNTVDYNHLIASFPSNIVRLFLHLKKKDLYSTEKKEIFEILKK